MPDETVETNCATCGSETTGRICWCHGYPDYDDPCDCSAPRMRWYFSGVPREAVAADA